MREQALATQQVLKAERDQVMEQCRLAQAREQLLQQQLDRLRTAHGEGEGLSVYWVSLTLFCTTSSYMQEHMVHVLGDKQLICSGN